MSNRKRWWLLTLLISLSLPLWAQPLPTVRTADLKTIQGMLRSNHGRVVLVYFWATYTPRCAEDMPDLVSLQSRYGPKGFQVVGISADELSTLNDKVIPFMTRYHVNFPVYLEGGDHEALVRFFSPTWVGQLPTTFIYNRKGTLAHELHGHQSLSDYEAVLQTLL